MTLFQGSLRGCIFVVSHSLFVGKLWGLVGDARVDYLNQSSPGSPRWFHTHIQLPLSLAKSVLFDSFMLRYCAMTTIYQTGQHVVEISRFELAIFAMLFIYTTFQYAVALGEIYRTQTRLGTEIGLVVSSRGNRTTRRRGNPRNS
jgi:E3 ubiquitin-protein ligase synoviolin